MTENPSEGALPCAKKNTKPAKRQSYKSATASDEKQQPVDKYQRVTDQIIQAIEASAE